MGRSAPPSTGAPADARMVPSAPRTATPVPLRRAVRCTSSHSAAESTSSTSENARSSGDAVAIVRLDRSAFQLCRSHAEVPLNALEELALGQAEFAAEVELVIERVPGQPQKTEEGGYDAVALQGDRAINRLGTVARH